MLEPEQDIRTAMSRAAEMSERARDRMFQDIAQQREAMYRAQTEHRGYAASLASGAHQAAAVTYNVASHAGAHVADNMMIGSRIAREQLAPSNSFASALGLGGDFTLRGMSPMADRGYSGSSYFASRQNFGGLLYEAGLGQTLNTITGGYFFRDAGQVLGVPRAAVVERAQQELALRTGQVGRSILAAMPGSARAGWAHLDLRSDRIRALGQRFSGVNTAGLAGALNDRRGFGVTSNFLSQMAEGEQAAFYSINRQMGWSLSDDDARSLTRVADSMLTDTDIQKMSRMSGPEVNRKREQDIRRARRMIEQLRVDGEEGAKLLSEFRDLFSPEQIGQVLDKFMQDYSKSNLQMSRSQYFQMGRRFISMGASSGMNTAQATTFARDMSHVTSRYYDQITSGGIDRTTAAMFGGADATEQAQYFAQAQARIGMQAGQLSPYMRTLASMDPTAFTAALQGGGYLSTMAGVSGLMATNPYAGLRGRFDPMASGRLQRFGMNLAFSQAQSLVGMTSISQNPEDVRAQGISAFMRMTGISNDVEGMRLYDMLDSRQRRLGELMGGGNVGLAMNIFSRLEEFGVGDGSLEKAAAIAKRLGSDAAPELLLGGTIMSALEGDRRVQALGTMMYNRGQAARTEQGVNGPIHIRSTLSSHRRFVKKNGTVYDMRRDYRGWADDGAGITGGAFKEIIGRLRGAGYTDDDINQYLQASEASSWGIRINGSEIQRRAKDGWVRLGDDESFGDDSWERSRAVGTFDRLTALGEDVGYMRYAGSAFARGMNSSLQRQSAALKSLFGQEFSGSSEGYLSAIAGDGVSSAAEKRLFSIVGKGRSASDIARAMRSGEDLGERDLLQIVYNTLIQEKVDSSVAQGMAKDISRSQDKLTDFIAKHQSDGVLNRNIRAMVLNSFAQREANAMGPRDGTSPLMPLYVEVVKDRRS